MQVQLTTYSGRVNMQANPSTIPSKWDDFLIKTDANDTELILDMRPWVRRHRANQLTGLYYICIKGELTSTYSLRLREFSQEWGSVLEIQDGYSEVFYSHPNSMRIHLYQVPKLEYTGEDIKIEFDLTVKRGNADLIMAASLCKENNTDLCTQNIGSDIINSKDSGYQRATNTGGQKLKLVIDHDEQFC